MSIKHICIAVIIIITGCNTKEHRSVNKPGLSFVNKSYDNLSGKYADKLLFTSINATYERIKLTVNDSVYDFPNIDRIDLVKNDSIIKAQVISFLSLHPDVETKDSIAEWCNAYLLLDEFFSRNKKIYFEDLAGHEKRFKNINHYLLSKEQDINALSMIQSNMLYLDFITFLSHYNVNERVRIINNASGFENW